MDNLNKSLFNERMKRVDDALALREPDRVPCAPKYISFPVLFSGHTMAEALYDVEIAKESIRKYIRHFEPDMAYNHGEFFGGQGPMLEKLGVKWLDWAGRPGTALSENSIQQFIEKPYLEDEEYSELLGDLTGWLMSRWHPRCVGALEPWSKLSLRGSFGYGLMSATMQFADPAVQESFRVLGEVGEMSVKWHMDAGAFDREIAEMGFPQEMAATVTTAFDQFSDCLRGTIGSLLDICARPEEVLKAVETFYPNSLYGALAQAEHSNGKFIHIPLHKGMDSFMSDGQYRRFYWDTLLRLVNDLIERGHIPWIYTEGPYSSRIECLMDLPKGKTFIHFEDADLVKAKKLLGDVACLSGGMRAEVLVSGTKEQVVAEVKRNMDILAPGGGYIFDLSDTMENCRVENVEVMFDTVKTYGKYR